jgi:hypothetical protein
VHSGKLQIEVDYNGTKITKTFNKAFETYFEDVQINRSPDIYSFSPAIITFKALEDSTSYSARIRPASDIAKENLKEIFAKN